MQALRARKIKIKSRIQRLYLCVFFLRHVDKNNERKSYRKEGKEEKKMEVLLSFFSYWMQSQLLEPYHCTVYICITQFSHLSPRFSLPLQSFASPICVSKEEIDFAGLIHLFFH